MRKIAVTLSEKITSRGSKALAAKPLSFSSKSPLVPVKDQLLKRAKRLPAFSLSTERRGAVFTLNSNLINQAEPLAAGLAVSPAC